MLRLPPRLHARWAGNCFRDIFAFAAECLQLPISAGRGQLRSDAG